MTLTPEATHALYADPSGLSLTEQLTAAYERNVTEELAPRVLPDALALVAATAIAEARAATPDVRSLPELLADFRSTLEISRLASLEVFGPLGIKPPELTEFVEAGIDFTRLGAAYEIMQDHGLQPEIVIAPVLSVEQWKQSFQALQDDPFVNHDKRIQNGGLYIDDAVATNWETINANDHSVIIDGQEWQVLVVPGTDEPPVTSLDHNGTLADGTFPTKLLELGDTLDLNLADDPLHPGLASYLTLQATKLHSLQPPLYEAGYTWLDGEFGIPDSPQAPQGFWGSGRGQVGVSWDVVGFRNDFLGVRLPVLGTSSTFWFLGLF